jgi:hypothetical protein
MYRRKDQSGYNHPSCLPPNHSNIDDGDADSARTSDLHCPPGTLLEIQRKHLPKQAQSLFLWDDAILFKPRKQQKTNSKPKEPRPTPNPPGSDVCIACIADWLLTFFGILVIWSLYSCSDQYFDAWKQKSAATAPVPVYLLSFWRTLARVTLLWCFIFGILGYVLWIIFNFKTWCGDDPLPHCSLAIHLAGYMLSSASSYLGFWWSHGRHNKPCPLRREQLADLDKGAVLLRLSTYPDLFTSPFLGWLNSMYLTYRVWQRWKAASVVFAELERDGKLWAGGPLSQCLVEAPTPKCIGEKNDLLCEETGHPYVEVDVGSGYMG